MDTLQGYLTDVQRVVIQLHLSANPRAEPFVDHAGILRDSRTGRPINGRLSPDAGDAYDDTADMMRESLVPVDMQNTGADLCVAGYSFFDSGDVEVLGRRKRAPAYYNTGMYLPMPFWCAAELTRFLLQAK